MKYFLSVCALLYLAESPNHFSCAVSLANGETKDTDIFAFVANYRQHRVNQFIEQNRIMMDNGISGLKTFCPKLEHRLRAAGAALVGCAQQTDYSLPMCQRFKIGMRNCTSSYYRLIDECVGYEERGLADLMSKSVVSILDHFCELRGEDILELLHPCLFEEPSISTQQLDECRVQVNELAVKYQRTNYLPTMQTFCSELESVKSCVRARVNLSCKNERAPRNFMRLLDAATAPCNTINEVQRT